MSGSRRQLVRLRSVRRRVLRRLQGLVGLQRKQAPSATPVSVASALPLEHSAYVSVIIPALNEAERIASVVKFALQDVATAEVIVIDDSSIDDTAALAREAGAVVATSSMLGKGASMQDGVALARSELLVYLDGDLAGLRQGIISELCAPLLRDEADFVKARFGRGGGRVTELTAKPMLKIFFPEVAHFHQPLGGVIAARKSLLQALAFENDYGVDIGLLLDAHLAGGRLAECDIGSLEHDSQSLQDLTAMANEVSRVIFSRAKACGRLHVEQVTAMYEAQRLAAAGLETVLTRRKGRERLLLVDLDCVTELSFAHELVRATGHSAALERIVSEATAGASADSAATIERIAKLFQYVHKTKFEAVAHGLAIRPGAIECVNRLRRHGFMVGLVSDSYFVAADIVRRRVFADFALAHTIGFDHDVCSGVVRFNSAFVGSQPEQVRAICKSHALRRLLADPRTPTVKVSWALSNNAQDGELLSSADRAFCIGDAAPWAQQVRATALGSFAELIEMLPNHVMIVEPHS